MGVQGNNKICVYRKNYLGVESSFDGLKVNAGQGNTAVLAPVTGQPRPITEVDDPVFSSKAMGDGFYVAPQDNVIVAPVDGEITLVFDTCHALGMVTPDGKEIMLHLGIDTVNMGGRGFTVFVEEGQQVKQGQKLMELDLELIRKEAKSDVCITVFTNIEDDQEVVLNG